MPNETSSFAAEGTAAHEVCAKSLPDGVDAASLPGMFVDIQNGTIVDTPGG